MTTEPDDAREHERTPLTYGALRHRVEATGGQWRVADDPADDEPVPVRPTGGLPPDSDEAAEERKRPAGARVDADIDVAVLVADLPPSDPGLRARWRERGIPLDRTPEPTAGDRPET